MFVFLCLLCHVDAWQLFANVLVSIVQHFMVYIYAKGSHIGASLLSYFALCLKVLHCCCMLAI